MSPNTSPQGRTNILRREAAGGGGRGDRAHQAVSPHTQTDSLTVREFDNLTVLSICPRTQTNSLAVQCNSLTV